jgi:hypothetical protein
MDWLDTGGEIPEDTPGGVPKWVIGIALLLLVVIAIIVVSR